MLLCSESQAFMDEEIAHGNVGVAKISPEGILTEEIIESASGRMLPEESAALMAWAVELGITVFNILLEILEERRKNSVFVMRSSAFYLTVIESMIRIIEIDDAVYLSDDRIIYKASLVLMKKTGILKEKSISLSKTKRSSSASVITTDAMSVKSVSLTSTMSRPLMEPKISRAFFV